MSKSTTKFNTPVDLQLDYKNNNLEVFKKWFYPYVEFTHAINGSAMVSGEPPSYEPTQQMMNEYNSNHTSKFDKKKIEVQMSNLLDKADKFSLNDVSLCVDIERHLSVSSTNHMALKADFIKAKKEKNAIDMWKSILAHHIKTSHSLMNKFKAKEGVDECKQNEKHIDEYCVEFLEKVTAAEILGAKLDQEEVALKFLLHLNPVYCNEVKKLINSDTLPKDLATAQQIAIGWSETSKIIDPEMGIKSKGEPPLKDSIAHVAKQTNNKKKQNKPSNEHKSSDNNNAKKNNNYSHNNDKKDYNNNKKDSNNSKKEPYCDWCKFAGHYLQDCTKLKSRLAQNKKEPQKENNKPSYYNKKDKNENNDTKSKVLTALADDFGYCLKANTTSVQLLSNSFYFDCAATSNIVNDLNLLTNIKEIEAHHIGGIGGSPAAYHVGDTDRFGPAYFLPSSPCNLISQNMVLKQNGTIFWNQENKVYEVTLFNQVSYFKRDEHGLYEFHPYLHNTHALYEYLATTVC